MDVYENIENINLDNRSNENKISPNKASDIEMQITKENDMKDKINEDLNKALDLYNDEGFVSDFIDKNKLESYIEKKEQELKDIDKKIYNLKSSDDVSKENPSIRLTVVNKNLLNNKNFSCLMPQIICSLGKKRLKNMYFNVNELKNESNEKSNEQNEEIYDAIDELFSFEDENALKNTENMIDILFSDDNMSKSYNDRLDVIEKSDVFFVTLNKEITRTINLPKSSLKKIINNKISNLQQGISI